MLSWLPMLAKGGDPGWFIMLILGGFAFGVVAILNRSQSEERRKALALRLGGRYEQGGVFSNSAIHFSVAERSSMMEFQSGRGAFTRLYVPLPASAPGAFKVTSVQLGWEMLRLIGYDSVRIGDPTFDASFAVTGDRGLIQRVFGLESRLRAMEAVRRLAVYPGLTLEFDTGSLQIRFTGTLDEEAFVVKLKRSAEDLIALVFGPPPATGIEWGESGERAAGLCPICTTVLKEPLIRCPRCRAPHHRECWDYLGRCAVYGCEPKPGRRAA
jgi:hypothetical protein